MNNKFTQEELLTLSNGLLALIDNVSKTKKLMYDEKIQELLNEEMKKYQELNIKVLELCE